MADKIYNSIDDLLSAIDDAVEDCIRNDIAPMMEVILQRHIYEDIYGVYSPSEYIRRYDLPKSIISDIEGGNGEYTISTTSNASPNASWTGAPTWGSDDGAFFDLLESDNKGLWIKGFARPTISVAQADVDANIGIFDDLITKRVNAVL